MDTPYLNLLAEGTDSRKALLLIKGYRSEKHHQPTAFTTELDALHSLGWQGAIYHLWWDASNSHALLFQMFTHAHWHKVKRRATQVGKDYFQPIIGQLRGKEISIIAHSLGVRITYYGLSAIDPQHDIIGDVILLGGALRRNKKRWPTIAQSIRGTLYNVYNRGDTTLSQMYKLAELRTNSPCGLKPIEIESPNMRNIDVTNMFEQRQVDHHSGYKHILADILKREQWSPHQRLEATQHETADGA